MFYLYFFALTGVHRLTTRVSTLTVTLVFVIHKAISLIISIIGIMHVDDPWFHFFSIDKIWIERIDVIQPWNLVGLDLESGRLAFLGV